MHPVNYSENLHFYMFINDNVCVYEHDIFNNECWILSSLFDIIFKKREFSKSQLLLYKILRFTQYNMPLNMLVISGSVNPAVHSFNNFIAIACVCYVQ